MKTAYGHRSLGAYLPFPAIRQEEANGHSDLAAHTYNQCSSSPAVEQSGQQAVASTSKVQSFDVLARGRKLFAEGYELERIGAIDAAEALYRESIEHLESNLSDVSVGQEGAAGRTEFARLALEHGTFLCRMGRIESARAALARAVELFEETARGDISAAGVRELATALSWYSLAQRKTNDFDGALASYVRAVSLWSSLFTMFGPMFGNIDVRQSLAINLIGLSKTYRALGNERQAALSLQESQKLLNLNPKLTTPVQ